MKKKQSHGIDWKSLVSSRLFIIIFLVILFDRITKLVITRACPCIINPVLNFITIMNKGVAFGMFSKLPMANFFFAGFAILAVAFIVFLYHKEAFDDRVKFGLALMAGGALGNVIDRLLYGGVIDIFDFHISIWHFPAFNVADSAVTVGAILVLWFTIKQEFFPKQKKSSSRKKK
jgi:signal peptidase II